MRDLAVNGDAGHGLGALTRSDGWLARALRGVAHLAEAETTDDVLLRFKAAAADLGADAAVFTSFLQDDATLASYRTLVACDPVWSAEYAREQWFEDDPWLRHAMHDAEPVRSSEILLRSPREETFAQAAARAGFASAVIAPAPSTHGTARIGMLALGSGTPGFFEHEGYTVLRALARAMAMELHAWLARSILRDLVDRARITADDIALLRHEAAGHSSKVIAAAMNTEAKTIDCRFQRVSSKLGAPNRRAAVRLARLYGLL
ncbi:MAG: autoinducer binding domain-containing protein [Thauera sp.]|nr:autoinducer binding domain-containing protein [Thauera sp.]